MEDNIQRSFIIGEKWIYYKIYCGVKTADYILSKIVKPISLKLLENRIITKWFFIRYADPKIHLKIRLLKKQHEETSTIINLFYPSLHSLIEQDIIWKVQIDTYQREIERYGANTIEFSESIFFYDSCMVVDMLDLMAGDKGEEIRWIICLRAIDELLNNFRYNIEQKRELLNILKESYGKEFGMNKNLKLQLDKKFRDKRKMIEEILDSSKDKQREIYPVIELLSQKTISTRPFVDEILKIKANNELMVDWNDLISSYIHMMCNRMFKAKQRMHEMVLYNLLYRYYKSEIARNKQIIGQAEIIQDKSVS